MKNHCIQMFRRLYKTAALQRQQKKNSHIYARIFTHAMDDGCECNE